MILNTDENFRSNRKPLMMNNEHDYSTWNINDYDMDLSEYLIDEKEETIQSTLLHEPEISQEIEQSQSFIPPDPPKKMYKHPCPFCDKRWVTPSKLKRHLSIHRNEIRSKETLKMEFQKSSVDTIKFIEPPNKEPEVQCPICFLALESQSTLVQHMSIHVKNVKPTRDSVPIALKIGTRYICAVCGSESSSPAKLKSHMKAKHMKKTNESGNKIKSNNIEKRQETAKQLKNRCTFCSKTCLNLSSLKRHISAHVRSNQAMRRQRPRKHVCPHCEKRFESPSKLKRHQSVHRDILQNMKRETVERSPVLEISAVTSILGD